MSGGPRLRPGEMLLQRYLVLEESEETALWVAYRAIDQQGAQGPAPDSPWREPDTMVKLVRPELAHDEPSRSYVLRELLRVRPLQHVGLLRPAEIHLLEDQQALVMLEPMQAGLSQGTLLSKVAGFRRRERDPYPLDEARQVGVQLAAVLGYLHGHGVCHGDLRPESVRLRPDGAKLVDVGLGRALPRGPYLDAVRQAGELELLAKEVQEGRPPDARSDVYGLAALYRFLISLGDEGLWEQFLTGQPALAAVLVRALQDDPEQRFPSVEALVADVEAVALTGAPVRRRRHSQTPLAMAVAAGRLPMEELDRPVEELVPEGRRRRNSGSFDANAVLMPLSNTPSARVSLGTIPAGVGKGSNPPAAPGGTPTGLETDKSGPTSGPSSGRSGRVTASGGSLGEKSGPTSGRSGRVLSGGLILGDQSGKSGKTDPPRPRKKSLAPVGTESGGAAVVKPESGAAPVRAESGAAGLAGRIPGLRPALDREARDEPRAAVPVVPVVSDRETPRGAAGIDPAAVAAQFDSAKTVKSTDLPADLLAAIRQAGSVSTPPMAAPGRPAQRPGPSQASDDIGAQQTQAYGRMDPADLGLRPAGEAVVAQAADAEYDHTIEQARLDPAELWGPSAPPQAPRERVRLATPMDPGDMPTAAVDLLSERDLMETPPNRPAGRTPQAPRSPVEFREMSPLGPAPALEGGPRPAPAQPARDPNDIWEPLVPQKPRPAQPAAEPDEPSDAPTGRRPTPLGSPVPQAAPVRPSGKVAAPVRVTPARPPSGSPRTPSAPTAKLPSPREPERRSAMSLRPTLPPPSKVAVIGALALAGVVGALAALLVASLLNLGGRRQTPPKGDGAPRSAAPAAEAPATTAGVAAPAGAKVGAPAPPPAAAPTPAPAVAPTPAPAVAPTPAKAAPAAPQGQAPAAPAAPTGKEVRLSQAPGHGTSAAAGPACPAGMVPVSGSGSGFCVDAYEYPGAGQTPRTGLSSGEAAALCQERGARLCSDDEWETACRGRGRSSYPYGHDLRAETCNTTGHALGPAGARPRCVSAAGALDMAGNAAEWVRGGAVRGGSADGDSDGRCSKKLRAPAGGKSAFVGFRCCASP